MDDCEFHNYIDVTIRSTLSDHSMSTYYMEKMVEVVTADDDEEDDNDSDNDTDADDDDEEDESDDEANLAQASEAESSVQYDSDEWEQWYVDHPEERPAAG